MVACSAVTWLIRGDVLDTFMFPFVFVSLLRQPVVRDESLEDARERLASAEASLAAARRVLWHLDDYRTLGLVRDDEFELVLRDERDRLESVKRERATIARIGSW